ncbi:hypothetical protein RHGRI_009892 [Rhododendron griersonianum]|uniref:F-box domain-containing protein n=1 Tax=Rhododendron griersonianum TaxID=479676 RepID=A0AAV6KGJ5_9ERIC|nr:hypothetical protein RHGRI_009892 [Rhododendron griersonianum]
MRRSNRKASHNTAAVGFPDLPNHITCDILSRLPLNSIFTCRRVCKTWRELTLERYFAKLHLFRCPLSFISYYKGTGKNSPSHFKIIQLHDPTDFGYHYATTKFKTRIYFPFHVRNQIEMVASCNGLILLANYPSRDHFIVCNPLRAQHFTLPKPPLKSAPMTHYINCECFGFGFGHCTATDQYKVLRYTPTITKGQTRLLEIDIYTLGIDDEWRSLGETAPAPAILTLELVFLNGALHWIGFQDSWLICYFDIEKEQFGSFPLPSHIGDAGKYLGVVDNRLYIRNEPFGVRKFWMMKDYGDFGSWTLECVVEEQLAGFLEPLNFLKDGSLLMSHIEEIARNGPKDTSLASYNPQTRVLKKINCDGLRLLWGATHAYVPCLFSPMDAWT